MDIGKEIIPVKVIITREDNLERGLKEIEVEDHMEETKAVPEKEMMKAVDMIIGNGLILKL